MFKPLLITILALAVVAAAVFVGGRYLGKEAADETAGWQTYRNKKYGFEFKYPDDWIIEESADIVIAIPQNFKENRRGMMIEITPISIGRESVFDLGSNLNIVEVNFAGKQAKLYICPDNNSCPLQLSYSKAIHLEDFPTGWDRFNEISFNIDKGFENLIPVYNRILNSFTFSR